MQFHEISWQFMNLHEIQENLMFWGARERIRALQPLKKHRNYLCFLMPAPCNGFLVNSVKFIQIQEISWHWEISLNSWNFMKIPDLLDPATLHKTFIFLAQNQGLGGSDPPKPENSWKSINITKLQEFHYFLQISWNFIKMIQKSHFGGFWWVPGRHMLETLLFP